MDRKVRVRFAPSPTGPLHIGGVRTALYNYLFAKQHGGDFILRIEDTDSRRFVPGAEEYILNTFKWLGLPFDEGDGIGGNYGPYKQSERRDIYRQHVEILLQKQKAYIAFDTPEELARKREEIPNFQYDASTRMQMTNSLTLSSTEVRRRMEGGEPYVVRFKVEPDEEIVVKDLIREEVKINSSVLDDKVLYKSADNLPTYHLANIVDDHLMQISHVIRGEEWLPSAPLHLLLYRAFGWEQTMPAFAHLPLLLKPEGNGKLSKRDGDRLGFPVFPLSWTDPITGETSRGYKESGYLPEAIINFLVLLGWNPGTQEELLPLSELARLFSIEKCNKSGARFDIEKAKWFNHQYLMRKNTTELARLFLPIVQSKGVKPDEVMVERVVELMKDRINFIHELWEQASFFFVAPQSYDEKTVKKRWKENTPEQMIRLSEVLHTLDNFSAENQEDHVKQWIHHNQLQLGSVMNAFRLCIVGESKGPNMFDITSLIGKEETIRRIHRAVEKIKN